ncbi:hypothetical protein BaRGS_00008491 [Batillaria attramentaria]|uniref:Uncharacterized protein n=1 Tax=Batillaria attramentaria TaxID=370345 RepID=A0ABD0LMN3_9CAEN
MAASRLLLKIGKTVLSSGVFLPCRWGGRFRLLGDSLCSGPTPLSSPHLAGVDHDLSVGIEGFSNRDTTVADMTTA